jgi:hypothetical protein
MANRPEDVVLRILREIQTTQVDHGRALAQHSREFGKLDLRSRASLLETYKTQ